MTSSAIDYLTNRLNKEGDKVERAILIEMITAWESKETEAERLRHK
jgi:hypothetical protein